jgi:hypothetical protein
MLRRGTHRIVIALALAAALLAPAAPLAAAPYNRAIHASSWRLAPLWTWARLWLGLSGMKNDAGLQIDPNGAKNDAGSHIDPDGAKNDAGAQIDPNG